MSDRIINLVHLDCMVFQNSVIESLGVLFQIVIRKLADLCSSQL